eukprot:5834973-Amphidinium_carterae.1
MRTALQSNTLTPAQAAKLRGVLTFSGQAMCGKVGRAALGPLKQRQYVDTPPWTLSFSLKRSFEFFQLLLDLHLHRTVIVKPVRSHIIVVASDAQADTSPTGGYVIAGQGQLLAAHYVKFPHELLHHW